MGLYACESKPLGPKEFDGPSNHHCDETALGTALGKTRDQQGGGYPIRQGAVLVAVSVGFAIIF